MKLYHYCIIFLILALAFTLVLEVKTNSLEAVLVEKQRLDQCLNTAVDDGTSVLVQSSTERGLVTAKEVAVETFFASLYSALHISSNKEKQELIQGYLPVILVTEKDGFYVFYSDTYLYGGYTTIAKRWSEKLPYYYEDEDFIYTFTLTDLIYLYDKNGSIGATTKDEIIMINYNDINTKEEFSNFRNNHSDSFLFDEEQFYLKRQHVIIQCIEEAMKYYSNEHNLIAPQYGISYNFSLPVLDDSDFIRSIDQPTMVVLFQGYPYSAGIGEIYNRLVVSGAKIEKSSLYYLEKTSWYYQYHHYDCIELEDSTKLILQDLPLYKVKDCVLAGAYACPVCCPSGKSVPEYETYER